MFNLENCPGCLGQFTKHHNQLEKPHPYIEACFGCWNTFSDILTKEFSDKEFFKFHRITVDSYASQHIGDQNDRRARQSACIHLIALHLYFDRNFSFEKINFFLKKSTEIKREWYRIDQIKNPKWMISSDILKAKNSIEHKKFILDWGLSVWQEYNYIHPIIVNSYEKLINEKQI